MDFIEKILGGIYEFSITLGLFGGNALLFFQCIEDYQNNRIDKVSFIGNLILSVVAMFSNIFIIFFNLNDYYLSTVDSIITIILGCGIFIIAIINFIRFLKDEDFTLAFYSKYFLIASLINIVVSIIYIPIFTFVIDKVNLVAGFFSLTCIGLLRLGLLSAYYLRCEEESYRYVAIMKNKDNF